ncbi:hypothetical protein EZS27_018367 [termite gut metagenome]|jgi:hypothetical protein|uniref:Uncharacterized protein n=1 Tax=termite gut metagenome TaxID=433724 RepID=A0A5J4RJB8_9ZZZZ
MEKRKEIFYKSFIARCRGDTRKTDMSLWANVAPVKKFINLINRCSFPLAIARVEQYKKQINILKT